MAPARAQTATTLARSLGFQVPDMTTSTAPHVAALYRYPVKGLSAEALTQTVLTPGETVPCDRIYAIENGPGRFDADDPGCVKSRAGL